jgi:hypothetical protein
MEIIVVDGYWFLGVFETTFARLRLGLAFEA